MSPNAPVVLVVEDEPLLLMAASEVLTDAGFAVAEARNADQAIAVLESREDVGLVFTDIDMPGSMDGLKLALSIRNRWPPIRLVITSGKMAPAVAELPADSIFFAKPYSDETLVATIRRAAA